MRKVAGRWVGAMVLERAHSRDRLGAGGRGEAAGRGAVRAIVTELAQAFEKETGHKVTMVFGPVGVTRQRLASDPADIVIMTDVAIDDAIKQGGVVAGTRADIARTGMGVGVREGAARPDIRPRRP